MADFCWTCYADMFPGEPKDNDFNIAAQHPDCTPPEQYYVDGLCEGCGPGVFNLLGQRCGPEPAV